MTTKVRLPKKVELPLGYEVTVAQVDPGSEELEGRHSAWDVDTQTICLDRSYSLAEKRGLLLHEMEHAFADWKIWVAQQFGVVMIPDACPLDATETEDESL